MDVLTKVIQSTTPPTQQDLAQLVVRYCVSDSRSEPPNLDFKESFDESNRAWLDLRKDVVAMSNSGGGVIIFGVRDDGTRIGCNESLLGVLDPAKISDKFVRHAPHAQITSTPHGVWVEGRFFVVLLVKANGQITIFEKDGNYELNGRPQRAIFHPGVVYTRRAGGNAPATQFDLNAMVHNLAQERVSDFLKRINLIAQLPPHVEIIARDPSKPNSALLLQEAGQGIPVSIVEDTNAAPVSVRSELPVDTPYKDVNAKVKSLVRFWKQDKSGPTIKRNTLNRWYLSRDHIDINDDVAELAFVSAGLDRGFTMYWASRMSKVRLVDTIRREIERDVYPIRDAIPYVVAVFLWEMRGDILAPIAESPYVGPRGLARRILSSQTRYDFLIDARRRRTKTFKIDDQEFIYQDYVDDKESCQAMFEQLLVLDIEERCTGSQRTAAHQLDILLHGIHLDS